MEHCPILRHLYSKSSWMRRVIPLRLLALPAELKTTLLIELGGRIKKYLNERMPCAQTRLFVAASQRLFHLFTCVHLFPCYWEEGWASTGCVLCQCECVDAEGPALPPLLALPALPALTAPMQWPIRAHRRSSCKLFI